MSKLNSKKNKVELLAPAGDPEKLEYALHYGADAVYAGLGDFSLRCRTNKFTRTKIEKAIQKVHDLGKRIYVTVNIHAHNRHLEKIEKHLKFLKTLNIDGVIVSDPGIVTLARKYLPKTEIHLSTQANTTNWRSAKFWKSQGVKRIILARELSLKEIKEIKKRVPGLELETFIHGAMCMSYSGRCLISSFWERRSANLGDCVQPCRWAYRVKSDATSDHATLRRDIVNIADVNEGREMGVEEDKLGTYFLNSKDLNLIEHVSELLQARVKSLKIEGRNKSVYYLAIVVRAYRRVLDAIINKVNKKELIKIIEEEKKNLNKLTHRGYTKGFLLGGHPEQNYQRSHEESQYEFAGEVLDNKINLIKIKAHNAIYKKDKLEIIDTKGNHPLKFKKILDENKNEVLSAHGGQNKVYYLDTNINKKEVEEFSLIRKKV